VVRGERANVTGATPTLRAGVIVAANGRVILVDMDHATHVHAPTSVRSLGELLALSMATPVPLRAVWRDDGTAREIWLLAGEVVHARHGALHGAPAVWAILDEPSRAFAVEHGREAPLRSVHASWRQLCHEARCRLLDREPPRVDDTWLDIAVDDLSER
jgi:hypothetical protein